MKCAARFRYQHDNKHYPMKTPLHYLVAARQNEIAELEQLGSACALVSRMSQLIHALQKERGLSNIFLASEGAQGREALDQHQPWVQQAIAELSATLEAFSLGLSGAHGARLFSAIAYALQGIEALPLLRAHRDGQRLTPEESTQAYMRLVAGCLTVVFDAADSACDPDISRTLVAMFHFMQGKELTGQERAAGAAAFASGVCNAARQHHWLHLIESQDKCFQVFADFASPAVAACWQTQNQSCADMAVIERLRRIACTSPPGSTLDWALNSVWFEACSLRLDAMHQIEALLAQELESLCGQKLALARTSLSQQLQRLQLPDGMPDPAPGQLADGMQFFNGPAPGMPWPMDLGCGPQLGRSILSLVQEQAQRLQLMQTEIDKARTSLKERKTIEQAKGVLMSYRQMSESDAYKLIRQTAMNQNRRMLDVAEAVLATVDLLPAGAGTKA